MRHEELLHELYQVPTSGDWVRFLEALRRGANVPMVQLFSWVEDDPKRGAYEAVVGMQQHWHRRYDDYYRFRNPYMGRSFENVPPVGHSEDLLPTSRATETEFNQDFARPQGLSIECIRAVCGARGTSMRGIGLVPELGRQALAFQIELMKSLLPHLRTVFRLTDILETQAALSAAACDAVTEPCFVCTTTGVVLQMNAAARALSTSSRRSPIRQGRLDPTTLEGKAQLQMALHAVREGGAGRSVIVDFDTMPRSFRAEVLPLRSRVSFSDEGAGVLVHLKPKAADAKGLRPLLVHDPAAADLPPYLRSVAALMARGASDKEVAVELGLPLATARTYAQRVLSKLGLHDRRELMRSGFTGR